MEAKIRLYYEKYKDIVLYLFFGVLTTLVNYAAYFACARLLPVQTTTIPTAIAWIVSVLFAYATNRKWVFESNTQGTAAAKEFTAFVGARLASGAMDVGIMYLAVDLLGYSDLIMKLLSNVIVVIVNYFLSKFFIFKKK